jgi:hypothetical protein
MRNKNALWLVAAAILVAGAAAAQDLEQKVFAPPKPVRLYATLAPEFGADAKGWARMESKGDGYYFASQITVRIKDYKFFGIDPNDGFDDEEVIMTLKGTTVKMGFAYLELTGPVFTVQEYGNGPVPVGHGDVAAVFVNGVPAATGKF